MPNPEEILGMAYAAGQLQKEQRKEAEPLTYMLLLANYVVYGSEAFCQQVIEWYRVGYNGLPLAPAQWQ
jgi:hypothetical protein